MKQYLRFFKPLATRKGTYVQEAPYAGNKNLLKFVEDHYKFPQAELLTTRRFLNFGNLFSKLTKQEREFDKEEVPPGYFLTIIFSIQGSIHDVTKYLRIYSLFGPWITLMFITLVYIFITMPLYMVFFFLSNFTRNSYLKIWLAVPILQGVSFSVAMLNFISCILNMSLVTLNILFIFGIFTNWLECGYPYETGTKCIAIFNGSNFCAKPGMAMPEVGTYVFLKYVVTSTLGDTINWYWMGIILFVYMLITFGSLYSKIVLAPVCRLTTIMWGLIFLLVLLYEYTYGTSTTIKPSTSASPSTLLQITFWVTCSKTSLRRVMPGDLVTYGSITMVGMNPITIAVLMVLMRIVFAVTVANFYVISLNEFISSRDIKHVDCLDVNGLTILYCFIPEHLLKIDSSKFAILLYLTFSTYMGTMSTFLSINGFLTAIINDYSNFREHKHIVVTIICVLMYLANTLVVGIGFEYMLIEEMKVFVAPYLTFCCVAFFITSYSPLRISNDFYFAFGVRLKTLWNSLMKAYVIFVAVTGTFYLVFDMHNMSKNNAVGANVVSIILVVFPILLVAIVQVYRARNTAGNLFQPDSAWGPPTHDQRLVRATFNAKRECRITMNLRCHHECLNTESKLNEMFLLEMESKYLIMRTRYLTKISTNDNHGEMQ